MQDALGLSNALVELAAMAVEDKQPRKARAFAQEAGPLAERAQNRYALAKLAGLGLWPSPKAPRRQRRQQS